MLKFDDSHSNQPEAVTHGKAMKDANYSNIFWGEAPTQGNYEAEE
jgi:hypothetical protein